MKKLLTVLTSITLIGSISPNLISCSQTKSVATQQVSIQGLKGISNIDEGMKSSEVRTAVLEQIRGLFAENIAQEVTANDFTINLNGDDDQVVEPRQNIIVTANADSSLIKDSFDFNVQANIDIVIEDESSNQIAVYNYETDFETLGEIMENDLDHYLLRDFGGDLGYYVYGISYYEADGKKYTIQEDPAANYWALYWVDDQGEEMYSEWGISSFNFDEYGSEHIIWRLTALWT